MSQETMEWLNTRTLVGFTEKRGHAWHYRATGNGEPNHYEGAIPVEDVTRRLFHWKPAEGTVETAYVTDEGVTRLTDHTRKTIVRPAGTFGPEDPGQVFNTPKTGYKVHDYQEWLVENMEMLLGTGLKVGTAGLLKGGAIAWVQVEMDETFEACGVQHRPFATAATSLDGSMKTTYRTGSQLVVCDNTLSAALRQAGDVVKVSHTRNSELRVDEMRDSLALVETVAANMNAQLEALTSQRVTDAQWSRFLDLYNYGSEKAPEKGRALTMGEARKDDMRRLYTSDPRVAPWTGTAFGVVQAVNTWEHHESGMRGSTDRVGRNMLKTVNGGWDDLDNRILADLDKALA